MREALLRDGLLKEDDFDLSFMYRHDCSVLDPEHELPKRLLDAASRVGAPLAVDAMTASCDAWFYNNQLNIPTVVYGAGTLKVAHSKQEHIAVSDIGRTAGVLAAFTIDYCGGKS
jgi:acetylornithine deacetylase/succinyl-diaminopimelate desuccinylase-like protein